MIADPHHVVAEHSKAKLPSFVDARDLLLAFLALADHDPHPAPRLLVGTRDYHDRVTSVTLLIEGERRHRVRLDYRGVMRPRAEYLGEESIGG